jgi:tetratricopeptide (TPR) repeat protein
MLAREAWVLYQAGRRVEARAQYIKLLDKFDSDHSSLENREAMRDIRLALSAVEVELENITAAEEWLLQTLDEFPEDIGAYNDLGYLWSDQGKHLNRSLRMIRKAVEAEPDNIAFLDSLGWALFRLGRFDEAIEPLEKAASGDDVDGVILDHLGDVYAQTAQPAKAVDTWRRALEAMAEGDDQQRRKAVEDKIKQHAGQ